MFESAKEFLATSGVSFLISIVTAMAIFFIGKWVAKLLTKLIGKLLDRAKVDETLTKFACRVAYAALLVFVVIASLDSLGVDTTSAAAIIAAAGLAIGFALQGTLNNFAAGVMLIFFRPFSKGDLVEAGGQMGVIEEIQIFNTIMKTPDNVQIIIPNGAITSGTITNYSAKEVRRIDLVFGCGYGDNLKEVKAYLDQVLKDDERVLEDPAPVVAVNNLGDSSVDFVVRPWVKAEDYWVVRWDLMEGIKLGFDERGFNIPYPTQDINVHKAAA